MVFSGNKAGVLKVAAGICFFFLCMLLPLVGRAGVQMAHAGRNHQVFWLVLVLNLVLSGAALKAGMKKDGDADKLRIPFGAAIVFVLCLLIAAGLLTGAIAA